MTLTPQQIALVANALALAAEEYDRHKEVTEKIDGAKPLADQFAWQAKTARELSGELMIARSVKIDV